MTYEFIGKVISKHRVTIPLHLSKVLGLKDGDYVRVMVMEKVKQT